ncbi:MAG: C40 family peptidase [Armatimonadetes bacterium]|nr:C40 family peptidase [Armatimonadota bacterium]
MQRYGVVTHNVVALRAEADAKSEMVSQALLGETVELKQKTGAFWLVGTEDGYAGWAYSEFILPYEEGERWWGEVGENETKLRVIASTTAVRYTPEPHTAVLTQLVFGSVIVCPKWYGTLVPVYLPSRNAPRKYYVKRQDTLEERGLLVFDGKKAVLIAKEWVGIPYLWGGSTPFGFDCSGFVQAVYRYFGIVLPRDAYLQASAPCLEAVPLDSGIREGDLLFFGSESDPRNRGITHVGMAIGGGNFIHASSRYGVGMTSLVDAYYLRYLRAVRRYHTE